MNQSIFNKKLEKNRKNCHSLSHTLTNCKWVTVHPTSSIYSQVEGVSANNHECFHVLDIFKNEREMLLGIPLCRLHQHPPRINLVIMIHQHSCTWPVKSPGLFLTMYSAWYICFNVRGSSSTSTCSSFDKVKYRKLGLPYNIRCFGSFKRGLKTSFQHKLNSYYELWFVYYGTFIRLLIANFCIVFIFKPLWTKASANS